MVVWGGALPAASSRPLLAGMQLGLLVRERRADMKRGIGDGDGHWRHASRAGSGLPRQRGSKLSAAFSTTTPLLLQVADMIAEGAGKVRMADADFDFK